MIISKKSSDIAINDIVSFRLVSGEEIVGKLVSHTDSFVQINKPISIGIQQQKGGIGLVFMPFMGSVSDDSVFTFHKTALVTVPMHSHADVRKSYIESTTGLLVPGDQAANGLLT